MTRVRKMSNEEQRVQHETISAIDMKVSDIVKIIKVWVPIFGLVCSIIGGIITLAITGYKYDANLVKQPQFEKMVRITMKQDSILNAKIDTVDKRKINYSDIKTELVAAGRRLKGVTQVKDKFGNITYNPVY